jgi:hypothetical protein
MTITLSDEEKRFIQACYNDSFNEGHFDPCSTVWTPKRSKNHWPKKDCWRKSDGIEKRA